jgi:hypothetical protein
VLLGLLGLLELLGLLGLLELLLDLAAHTEVHRVHIGTAHSTTFRLRIIREREHITIIMIINPRDRRVTGLGTFFQGCCRNTVNNNHDGVSVFTGDPNNPKVRKGCNTNNSNNPNNHNNPNKPAKLPAQR